MTNVRTNSRDARAELDRHLEEAEYVSSVTGATSPDASDKLAAASRREVAALREEVSDLRRRLTAIRSKTESMPGRNREEYPWLRIGATVLATFALGKLVQRFRLGAPGAAAVPLIAAQIDRRIW